MNASQVAISLKSSPKRDAQLVNTNFLENCSFEYADPDVYLDEAAFAQLVEFQRLSGGSLIASISFKARGGIFRVMDRIIKETDYGILLHSGTMLPYTSLLGVHLIKRVSD